MEPVRWRKKDAPGISVTLKAGGKVVDTGSPDIGYDLNGQNKHVDVITTQGATLGLGLSLFGGSRTTALGISGNMKYSLSSGIEFRGTISITKALWPIRPPPPSSDKPIVASFQKTSLVVYCPWCQDYGNVEEEIGRDLDDYYLSDLIAETDSIPAPSGFTFMIGSGGACAEAHPSEENWYMQAPDEENANRACNPDDATQEFAIENGHIMSLYHENKCLAFKKSSSSDVWVSFQECDNIERGYSKEWEFKENGAIVGAGKYSDVCLQFTGDPYLMSTYDCDSEKGTTTKFWWITKSFMLTTQSDYGDVQCMLASSTYQKPYLSTSSCGPKGGKNEFMLTSNGMILNDYDGWALTHAADSDYAYWSSDIHGEASQVYSFTVDGKVQVSDTEQCLITNSKMETYPDNNGLARLFFGDCDYLGYQKLITSSDFEHFGNRGFDQSYCLWHDNLLNEESELFMRKCDGVDDDNLHRIDWMLKEGQLVSTTSNGTLACAMVNTEDDFVYISTEACEVNTTATFSYDFDTFKIRVFAGGEEKCLDADGDVKTVDGEELTTVALSDCSGRSYSKMWGIMDFIHNADGFLHKYAHFHYGYSNIYSPEYGPSMCLIRDDDGSVILDEPNEDEPSCAETYWFLKADTKQLTPSWDRSRCLDSYLGMLKECDDTESQIWSYDRSTLMLHSTHNDEDKCLSLRTSGDNVYLTTVQECDTEDPLQRFGPSWRRIVFDVESLPGSITNVEKNTVLYASDSGPIRLFGEESSGTVNMDEQRWMLHTDGSLSPSSDPFSCAMIMDNDYLSLQDCTDDEDYVKTFYYDTETLQFSYNYFLDDGNITKACLGYEFTDEYDKLPAVKGGFDCDYPDGDAGKLEWIL